MDRYFKRATSFDEGLGRAVSRRIEQRVKPGDERDEAILLRTQLGASPTWTTSRIWSAADPPRVNGEELSASAPLGQYRADGGIRVLLRRRDSGHHRRIHEHFSSAIEMGVVQEASTLASLLGAASMAITSTRPTRWHGPRPCGTGVGTVAPRACPPPVRAARPTRLQELNRKHRELGGRDER